MKLRALLSAIAACGALLLPLDAPAQHEPHAAPALRAAKLSIGDKAPPLEVTDWLHGDRPRNLERGRVHLVFFWATWCQRCRASFPELNQLTESFGERATLTAVAMQIKEGADPVRKVLEELRPEFPVAYDGRGDVADRWMGSAERDELPVVFLVNQQGQVAWIGEPGAGLAGIVEQVVAGKFDLQAARARAAREAEIRALAAPIKQKFARAMSRYEYDAAAAALDELFAIDHERFAAVVPIKFRLLLVELRDADAAYRYIAPMIDGPLRDDGPRLHELARAILFERNVPRRDGAIALKAARRSLELARKPTAPLLATIARAHFELENFDEAIRFQQAALDAETNPESRNQFKAALERFERARAAAADK